LFNRLNTPLLATVVVMALALIAFPPQGHGDPEKAETAPGQAAAPAVPAPPAAPEKPAAPAAATPQESPAPAAPETPAAAVQETPAPAAPAQSSAPKKGQKAAPKQSKKKKGAPPEARTQGKYLAGEDPDFAKRKGWPVKMPDPLPGAILPHKRIVAYYGNPLSKRMGALGEYPKDDMLRRLKQEVAKWEKADPSLPVQPALHLVTVVAQGEAGKAGKYRMIMPDKVVNQVYDWAKEVKGILFLDIQTGHSDIRTILPRFEWILKNPDVHLGIDPEFNMIKSGKKPGTKIGTYDAADINYAAGYLRDLVKKYNLPPKVFIVHRFTRNMVTNAKNIQLHPEVQIVMNMDGWGAPWLKRDSYRDYVVSEPVQFTGFKLFYHNDTKKGDPLMTPQDLLKLNPKPIYIQYQ
jgi:hypothetical protein